MKIELEVQEGRHISPKWWNLNFGGFQEVIVCKDCKINLAAEDSSVHSPCRNCGGFFSGFLTFTGIYKNGKWCKRI